MKRLIAALTGVAVALPGASAQARERPYYDALADQTSKKLDPSSIAAARSRSASSVIGHVDEASGEPTFVWAKAVPREIAASLATQAPASAARAQLGRHAEQVGLSKLDASAAPVQSVSRGLNGMSLVSFRQEVDGIEVFRKRVTVALNGRNEAVALSGSFASDLPRATGGAKLKYSLDAAEAIAAAYSDLSGQAVSPSLLSSTGQVQGRYSRYNLVTSSALRGTTFNTPARVKKVIFPEPGKATPAYYVELDTRAMQADGRKADEAYAYVVSARDGSILFRKSLIETEAYSYRVYADSTPPYTPWVGPSGVAATPHPTGTPNGYRPPFVPGNLVTLANGPISTNDPWLAPGATATTGNNVEAYADLVTAHPDGSDDGFTDGGDLRAIPSGPNAFDWEFDPTQDPSGTAEQKMAAITNLFFMNNWLHDWWYDRGFKEADGNAQASNYGRGGIEGDSILAEAQDHSGTNNANMFTPADGERPRMQMYLFGGEVDRTLTITAPADIAKVYPSSIGFFGPEGFDVTGDLVLALDPSDATGALTTDGCSAFTNAAAVAGKIAVIDRGTCSLQSKVLNAQNAGAVGAIIVNNRASGIPNGMPSDGSPTPITIAAMSVLQTDGATLKAKIATGATVTAHMVRQDTSVDIDGTVDNGIVAHEWGHYISNRLVHDGAGLGNNQGRSMGEGWGDFTALMMIVREGDNLKPNNANFGGVYTASEYAVRGPLLADTQSAYYGIRRYPYSTNMLKNPLTFRHIMDGVALPTGIPTSDWLVGVNNAEVHNSGEVWATMLWECYTSLLNDPRHTFAEAQRRMAEYLVAGYKLTPASPTFLEARDALLAATLAADEADFRLFTKAFAKRGAGTGAVAPSRSSSTHAGVVESYITGPDVAIVSVTLDDSADTCDRDGVLDTGETGKITVTLRNSGTEPLSETTAKVSSTTAGVTFANGGVIQFGPIGRYQTASATVDVSLSGAAEIKNLAFAIDYKDAAQVGPYNKRATISFRANTDDVAAISATETAETRILPWTSEVKIANPNPAYHFARTVEAVGSHFLFAPNAPEGADVTFTSPALQVKATGDFGFSFRHRYALEGDPTDAFYDGGVIEISTDGGATWTDITTKASDAAELHTLVSYPTNPNPLQGRKAYSYINSAYPGFNAVTVNLGTAYAGQTVNVRFRIGSDLFSGFPGWWIDDIAFSNISNTPFASIVADRAVCLAVVADAGTDQEVNERTKVTLNGNATDGDANGPFTFKWVQTSGPAATLSSDSAAAPTFTAPEVVEDAVLVFEVTATNSRGQSGSDSVSITVHNVNRAPTAAIAVTGTKNPGETITLDGGGSTDPDGEALTYAWKQTSGEKVQLSSTSGKSVTFVAPKLKNDRDAILSFELTVTDGSGATAKASTSVSITKKNDGGCSTTGGSPASLMFPLMGLAAWAFASRRRRSS